MYTRLNYAQFLHAISLELGEELERDSEKKNCVLLVPSLRTTEAGNVDTSRSIPSCSHAAWKILVVGGDIH